MLSHWDTLALDERSRPISGISAASICGVQVEVFRNWVNIRNEMSWTPASGLHRPICAVLSRGEMTFHDMHVAAERGPRDGVYVASWFMNHEGKVEAMVAIGCLGYDPGLPYRGILQDEIDYMASLLSQWRDAEVVPRDFPDIRWSDALRFCQGDNFIASKAGFPTPATSPGQADTPMAMRSA